MMSTLTDLSTLEENYYNTEFIVNAIMKETPKEKRFVKQMP
jgi:hypothetical protein